MALRTVVNLLKELIYLIKTWQTNLLRLDFHQSFIELILLFGEV